MDVLCVAQPTSENPPKFGRGLCAIPEICNAALRRSLESNECVHEAQVDCAQENGIRQQPQGEAAGQESRDDVFLYKKSFVAATTVISVVSPIVQPHGNKGHGLCPNEA